jgi:hypothetical protein
MLLVQQKRLFKLRHLKAASLGLFPAMRTSFIYVFKYVHILDLNIDTNSTLDVNIYFQNYVIIKYSPYKKAAKSSNVRYVGVFDAYSCDRKYVLVYKKIITNKNISIYFSSTFSQFVVTSLA